MRRIEARGVIETAHRALQDSGQVFRYAVGTGRAKRNPARELKDALWQPNPRHFPEIVEPPLRRAVPALDPAWRTGAPRHPENNTGYLPPSAVAIHRTMTFIKSLR